MRKHCIYRFFILWIVILLSDLAAQVEAPGYQVNGEYIREWLVLGPFFSYDLEKDYLIDAGGEANVEPRVGDFVINDKGDTLRWKHFRTTQPVINLLNAVGNFQNATAYAFCIFKCDVYGKHQALLGSDDGAAVWINGERIHNNPVARPLFLDHDVFEVDLKKGENRCLVKISQGIGNWGFAMRVHPHNQFVDTVPHFYLSADYLKNDFYLSASYWKFHSGDNADWANPDFDDSSWEISGTELRKNESTCNDWQGVGWFRLHITIDSTLFNETLGLSAWQAGTTQFFLDGNLVGSFNKDWTGIPKTLSFKEKKNYVIAVRYSNASIGKFHRAGMAAGFTFRLGDINQMAEERISYERPLLSYQMIFTTLSLAIGLLHLILFVFSPGFRQNLYFALFLFSYAAAIYFDYQQSLLVDAARQLFSFKIHRALWPIFLVLQLRFVYSLFYDSIRKQKWQFGIISLLAIGLSVLAIYNPILSIELIDILVMAIVVEICRVIIVALKNKKEGAWIIGLAFLVFVIFLTFDYIMDAGIMAPFQKMNNPYAFGIFAFFIAMSIYLSRDFSHTNKKLAEQEIERKLLEAENARQSKELEEARQLQISMLPKELPQLDHLEIGVYMKTATEVGGDYYDFKLHEDGTLTVAIGDATGHGMQAGTMVSATKSLFRAFADEPSPGQFLKKGTLALNEMGLKKMFMALTIAKFRENRLMISAAGMPFPLIYRASTGLVEEIVLKGMPLGAFSSFPYAEKMVQLNKGDTILLLSDGFEEMFNPQNETIGEERVKQLYHETGTGSPEKIINFLSEAGEIWANGRNQEDDVTFVVIKVK